MSPKCSDCHLILNSFLVCKYRNFKKLFFSIIVYHKPLNSFLYYTVRPCCLFYICKYRDFMLKILQARLQQYVNHELPDVQAGFRQGRGTRDQIANIHWITEKAREFQKNIFFCFIDYAKAFDCVDHNQLENSERDGNTRTPDLPLEKPVCRSGSNS